VRPQRTLLEYRAVTYGPGAGGWVRAEVALVGALSREECAVATRAVDAYRTAYPSACDVVVPAEAYARLQWLERELTDRELSIDLPGQDVRKSDVEHWGVVLQDALGSVYVGTVGA
jgi:hypothetical protein